MQLTHPKDIGQLGTILCVWAHPDDESFTCAGILAAASGNGQTVACITATKGELGVQDESRWPAAELGEIRQRELSKALEILGIKEHHWLGYRDGECEQVPDEEGTARVRQYIEQYNPDTILTFGSDGLTGHPDHQTVSKWVNMAARGHNIAVFHAVENEDAYENYLKDLDRHFNIYFNIDKPPVKSVEECDIALYLTPELIQAKYDALAAMPSQMERLLKAIPEDDFKNIFGCECFVRAKSAVT